MTAQTLSVKVTPKFAAQFRKFCEAHFLQVGKFTEYALTEIMEDFHFGQKAQSKLSQESKPPVRHQDYFQD